MTVNSTTLRRTSPGLLALCLSLAMIAAMVGILPGCGGGEAEGSASFINLNITPEAAYPDVDVEVSFEIAPEEGYDADDFAWRVNFGDGTTRSGEGVSASATHRFSRPGEFIITIEAIYDGDSAATEDVPYRVYDPVDLSISAASAQPANIQVGETITVSSTLRNETAAEVLTPFAIRAYLSETSNITREDIDDLPVIGDSQLTANDEGIVLSGGATRNIGINAPVPNVPTGQYHVVVLIDPNGQLADSSPENNLAISPGTVRIENLEESLPDIAVQSLEVLPDRAFPELNRVTRAFSLNNLGNEDVFNVIHRTYLMVGSPVRDSSAQLLHESSPVNISARQERSIGPEEFVLSAPIVPPAGEELEVYIIVEAFSDDGDVEEIRDDNNIAASDPPIIVSDQPVEGPDIAVHEFKITPSSTYLGGNLQVEAVIANDGTEDVSSFFCGIYMGPEPQVNLTGDPRLTNINIASLDAGATREVERFFIFPALYSPGTYYFYIVCDPHGAIDEPFRGNNQLIQLDPITITNEADIDLYVNEVTLPQAADDGDLIEVVAEFCVSGANSTGNTVGELYRSPGTSVDYSAEPYMTFDLPNINPGECLEMTFEIEARCEDFVDQLTVGIFADANGSLPEENVANNRRASDSPLQLDGRYCECEADGFGPNQRPLDATLLGEGTYDASICEVTKCDYYSVDLLQGESLLITTEFESDRGALETTLFAPGGTQILDRDNSDDLHEVAVFLASNNRRHIFSVCPDGSNVRNYYDFEIQILEQSPIVDVLPRDVEIPPQNTFSIGATIDVDVRIYNIGQQVTGDFSAEIVLTTDREVGDASDISLAMHDIASISAGSYRDVTLPVSLPTQVSDGEYYLAVVLDPNEDLNEDNVDNNIAFSRRITIETQCYDAFTPNDTFAQAATVGAGTYANLVSCAGKSDYYEICAPNGHSVDARILFDNSQGDLDATLYNQHLEVIDSSAQTGVDIEEVNVEYVNGAQCYYLRVYLVTLDPNAETTYQLEVDIEELPPELQCDPIFEPNDDFDTSTSLWSALHHDGLLNRCPVEDTDFFHIQLSPGTPVTFRGILEPSPQPGTLRVQLYRPNLVPDINVETGPGNPIAEITNYQPPVTGLYYLQITVGGNERRVTYQLEADGLPGVDLAAENLSIGPGTYEPTDEIRYGFDLTNYGGDDVSSITYRVYLSTSQVLDTSSAQLLGDFSAPDLDGDESVEIEGQVNVPSGNDSGAHYLHVFVDPDDLLDDVNRNNNRASVSIQIVDPAP